MYKDYITVVFEAGIEIPDHEQLKAFEVMLK